MSIEAEDANRAWTMLMTSTRDGEVAFERLRPAFVDIMLSGEPLKRFDKIAGVALADTVWTWPWLDDWIGRFEAAKHWPYLWPDFAPSDPDDVAEMKSTDLANFKRDAAIPLIGHSAAMISYRMRDLRQVRVGVRFELVSMGDAGEDWAAAPFTVVIGAGDLSVVPPFFPGDRTGLRQLPAGRHGAI